MISVNSVNEVVHSKPVLWDNPEEWGGMWDGFRMEGNMWTHTDSGQCMAKTTTILQSNYLPVKINKLKHSSVQLLRYVWLFVIPWTAACQASLSITNSQSLLKLMSIESVMSSKNLILCHTLLPHSILPSIRLFSHDSALHQVAKVLEFQLQHQSFQWIFRADFL